MDSPAPSSSPTKSKVSLGPPSNGSPEIRVKQERVESPAPSCLSMKSDWSMGQPLNFQRECMTPEQRVKQERVESPALSCVSMKSDRSMEQPGNFKREGWTPELSSSLLTEDHFRCSVCSEGLREPVSIPCGHSCCRQCISTYWAQPGLAGDYVCPQCSKSFPTRPELSTNAALVRVLQALQQAGFSPALPAVAHAGPGDVACDICCGPKLRAVKTCVTCSASYCESHVRQHYTVPALQRHTLTQVTGDQRRTHQQDSIKMESVKEEKEDILNSSSLQEKEDMKSESRREKKRSWNIFVGEDCKEENKSQKTHSKIKEEDFESGQGYSKKKMRVDETENEIEYDPLKSACIKLLPSELKTFSTGLQKENSELKTFLSGLLQKYSELKTFSTGLQKENSELKVFATGLQKVNFDLKTALKSFEYLKQEYYDLKRVFTYLVDENSTLNIILSKVKHQNSEFKNFFKYKKLYKCVNNIYLYCCRWTNYKHPVYSPSTKSIPQ